MRLVSLCPSLTELVFDLGCGEQLVGRTAWCCHPRGAVERIEAVGGTKTPDLPRILALRPDLVLMNDEENRREDWQALRAAGLRVESSLPVTAAETAAMVRSLGAVLDEFGAGAAGRARAIAEDIERRAARVAAAAQERATGPAASRTPLRFAYLIWREPWMGVGRDTYASALLALAGGVNVLGENRTAGAAAIAAAIAAAPHTAPSKRYPQTSPAALAALRPDLVLLGSEPFPFGPRHITELAALTGLPASHFQLADGELLSWHGSRTPAGIDYAESLVREALLRLTAPPRGA